MSHIDIHELASQIDFSEGDTFQDFAATVQALAELSLAEGDK